MVGEMRVMDATGDLKINWDTNNPDEVTAAKEQFDKLKKKGFLAYTVNKKGDKGEVINSFDPDAALLIMAPAMRGG